MYETSDQDGNLIVARAREKLPGTHHLRGARTGSGTWVEFPGAVALQFTQKLARNFELLHVTEMRRRMRAD